MGLSSLLPLTDRHTEESGHPTRRTMPGILLGDVFPNFEADTTIGKIKFHDFLGDSWGVLFSHPRDFTPVCTTELACAAKVSDQFTKRNVKMIALSIDSVADHLSWSKDVMAFRGEKAAPLPFPIIADHKRELSVLLGMLDPDELDKDGMPLTARCVFVIGPDKKLKLSILYPNGVTTQEVPSGKRYLRFTQP